MDKLTALKLINKKLEIEIRKAQNELKQKQFNLLEFKQNLSNSIDKWMLEQLQKEQEKRQKNNVENIINEVINE